MTIAFDAFGNPGANYGSSTTSWTHTPVGTPRGILVLIVENATATDGTDTVTYGGVPMVELSPDSPFLASLGAEDGSLDAFFLGSGIPPGPQTVEVVPINNGNTKNACSISVTADSDTEVEDTATFQANTTTTAPLATLVTGAGVETVILGALKSANNSGTTVDPGADYTQIRESAFGTATGSWIRRTVNGSGGSYAVDWTQSSDEAGVFAVAIKESAVSQGTRLAMMI